MQYRIFTTMLFGGLFLLFLGLLIDILVVSMIGAILWVVGDSYEPIALLSVKEIFLRR